MTAPNLPLAAEDLDYIEDSAEQDMNDLTYLVDCHHFRALIAQARAAIPDPNALPLSTAMREARRRTEAGDETWVVMTMPTWDRPKLLRIEDWCWYTNRPGWPAWVSAWASAFEQIETVVCKLVTPWEGERILRGESGE